MALSLSLSLSLYIRKYMFYFYIVFLPGYFFILHCVLCFSSFFSFSFLVIVPPLFIDFPLFPFYTPPPACGSYEFSDGVIITLPSLQRSEMDSIIKAVPVMVAS